MIPTRIAQYELSGSLGKGGMGEVHRAEDTKLRRSVAIKFLSLHLTESPDARKRFQREARAAAAIDHPNVCPIYDFGDVEGQMYIVMACLEGVTLREKLRDSKPTLNEAVDLIIEISRGLTAIHNHGIVHRDIKPSNIMLETTGGLRILDFGLARLSDESNLTPSGAAIGTVSYMSPEQITGGDVDSHSDLFSLGIILSELIYGEHPFPGTNQASVIHRILSREPMISTYSGAGLTPSLKRVVAKSLQKDPKHRYASADEMRQDLVAWQEDADSLPTGSLTLGSKVEAKPSPRSHRWRTPSIVAIVLLLAATLVFRLGSFGGLPPAMQNPGLVVLGASPDFVSPAQRTLTTGLVWDVAQYAALIASQKDAGWVVPYEWSSRFPIVEPNEAAALFGVQRVLVVSTRSNPAGIELSITRLGTGGEGEETATVLLTDSTNVASVYSAIATIAWETNMPPENRDAELDGRTYVAWLRAHGEVLTQSEPSPAELTNLELMAEENPQSAKILATVAGALLAHFETVADSAVLQQARQVANRAVVLNGGLADAHLKLASILEKAGLRDQAQAILTQAAEGLPDYPEIRLQLARIHSRAGEVESAEGVHRSLVADFPNYVGSHERLGAFLYRHGRYSEALVSFNQAAHLAPAYAKPFNYLGACYYALDCWSLATEMFRASFELGKSYLACANLATLLYMQRQFEEAARMYEFTLEYAPDDYETLGGLAAALYWVPSQREKSVAHYAKAARLAETSRQERADDPQLLSLLAGFYAVFDSVKASQLLQTALDAAPGDEEVLYRSVLGYEVSGQRARALVYLRQYIEQTSSHLAIEHEPFLDDLRTDPRYDLIMGDNSEPDCMFD